MTTQPTHHDARTHLPNPSDPLPHTLGLLNQTTIHTDHLNFPWSGLATDSVLIHHPLRPQDCWTMPDFARLEQLLERLYQVQAARWPYIMIPGLNGATQAEMDARVESIKVLEGVLKVKGRGVKGGKGKLVKKGDRSREKEDMCQLS